MLQGTGGQLRQEQHLFRLQRLAVTMIEVGTGSAVGLKPIGRCGRIVPEHLAHILKKRGKSIHVRMEIERIGFRLCLNGMDDQKTGSRNLRLDRRNLLADQASQQ